MRQTKPKRKRVSSVGEARIVLPQEEQPRGVGLSQRMQSFVLDKRINPYNVVEPGKRPRATLTPSMALKDGRPIMAFSVQGGASDYGDDYGLAW